MDWFQALVLGIVQGLTEFLPVSSSGHLIIGKALFGIETRDVSFEVVVHAATALATVVVFRKLLWGMAVDVFRRKRTRNMDLLLRIAVAVIPVFVVGMFFKAQVEAVFGAGLPVVGGCLLLTSVLLVLSARITKKREKAVDAGGREPKPLGFLDAFIIGVAQAAAVLPGLSRSGATIATGLLLGVSKNEAAAFSFLIVLIPVLGEAFLDVVGGNFTPAASGIGTGPLVVGFLAAFFSGMAACRWMLALVRKARLEGFALYCFLMGMLALAFAFVF